MVYSQNFIRKYNTYLLSLCGLIHKRASSGLESLNILVCQSSISPITNHLYYSSIFLKSLKAQLVKLGWRQGAYGRVVYPSDW